MPHIVPADPLLQAAEAQPLQGEVEEADALRLYFSTGSHLYELLYQRTEVGYLEQQILPQPLYRVDFLSQLRELPFTGDSWFQVVGHIHDPVHGAYLHISPFYNTRNDDLGSIQPIPLTFDIACVLLIRPSHTSSEIARLWRESNPGLWHGKALNRQWFEGGPPPPLPSGDIQRDGQGEILYDVFALGSHSALPLTLGVRLVLENARKLGEQAASKEGGMLLLYHDPEDTLECLMLPSPPLPCRTAGDWKAS
jgi:hypothetical protein